MNILLESHQQFLFNLIRTKVEFILVGGYAVIYYGYGRTTGDMDLWLKPTEENKEKLVEALRKYGIVEEDLQVLKSMNFDEATVFHIGDFPDRIDFLTKMVGLKYPESDQKKAFLSVKDFKIPVIHFDDLIVNKLLSNRAKDKADVEELQKIMRLKKN